MDVDSLRYVVALAQELHFGRAAARCFVAEGHFGRRIRRLERELGTRLFDRTTPRVALTEAGARVVAHARSTLASLAALRPTPGDAPADDSVLRVGVLGFGLADRWPCFADAAVSAVPGLRMVHEELDLLDQYDAVRRGEVDVGLVHHLGDLDGLAVQPVLRTPRVAVVPATSPLADAEHLTRRDVAGYAWLAVAGSASRLAGWVGSGNRSVPGTSTVRQPSTIPLDSCPPRRRSHRSAARPRCSNWVVPISGEDASPAVVCDVADHAGRSTSPFCSPAEPAVR